MGNIKFDFLQKITDFKINMLILKSAICKYYKKILILIKKILIENHQMVLMLNSPTEKELVPE